MGIEDYQFKKGDPKPEGSGRKVGVRNKLSERFLKDLHDEWERSGSDTLKILAKENPEAFDETTANARFSLQSGFCL